MLFPLAAKQQFYSLCFIVQAAFAHSCCSLFSVAQYTSILMTLLMVLMSLTLMVSELTLLPQLNENIPMDDRDKAYGGSIL